MEELETIVKPKTDEYWPQLVMRSTVAFSIGYAATLMLEPNTDQVPHLLAVGAVSLKKINKEGLLSERFISSGSAVMAYTAGNLCAKLSLYIIKN
jgi:hypothetical protein